MYELQGLKLKKSSSRLLATNWRSKYSRQMQIFSRQFV